jgi:phospholipid/cholesterol/gamma-HCH transport system permease protein
VVLHVARPTPHEVTEKLGEGGAPSRALRHARPRELGQRDPHVPRRRRRPSDELSVEVDLSGLPPGVQRLLALVEAVPEKKGARATDERQAWLTRVGESAIETWKGFKEFVNFIGEVTIALGEALRLRARVPLADVWLFVQNTGAEALADRHVDQLPRRSDPGVRRRGAAQQFGARRSTSPTSSRSEWRARWARS